MLFFVFFCVKPVQLCKLNLFFYIGPYFFLFSTSHIYQHMVFVSKIALYFGHIPPLKKRVKNITRGGTNAKKIHSDAFYSSRLSVRPAHLPIQPMNVRMWGCGRSLDRGGAAAASQHRSNKRTGSWALFGGCEWAPSPPSEMWTDIWTLLLFHSVILRLHLVTGNPERACFTMGGK